MSGHPFPPAAESVDPHTDRLLRDLIAIELLEANDGPSADERLTAELGEDLLRVLRLELARLDSGALPVRGRPQSAA
jgi:hypothetical protein